jgi:hypothetical protein
MIHPEPVNDAAALGVDSDADWSSGWDCFDSFAECIAGRGCVGKKSIPDDAIDNYFRRWLIGLIPEREAQSRLSVTSRHRGRCHKGVHALIR